MVQLSAMVTLRVVLLSLLLAAPALAKPLPADLKVSLKKGKPYLTKGKLSVLLVDTWTEWQEVKAELGDDGSLLLHSGTCGMGIEDGMDPTKISAKALEAKLANAEGMALHVKKKYAESAKLFEQANALDPVPVYATNLLSALAMNGEVERANKLLEGGIGSDQTAWFAWRLAVDPELKKLKGQPGTKPFFADKPTKLTSKQLGEGVAESSLGVAAIRSSDSYGGVFMSFVELKTGKETLRLPMKSAAQRKVIDNLLGAMGFVIAAKKTVDFDEAEKLAKTAVDAGAQVKYAAATSKHVVYAERTAGCDVAEYDIHAGATKL